MGRYSSGFDREYIVYSLMKKGEGSEDELKQFADEQLGFNEIDTVNASRFLNEIRNILDNDTLKDRVKIFRLKDVLFHVEGVKIQSFVPQAKVEA